MNFCLSVRETASASIKKSRIATFTKTAEHFKTWSVQKKF